MHISRLQEGKGVEQEGSASSSSGSGDAGAGSNTNSNSGAQGETSSSSSGSSEDRSSLFQNLAQEVRDTIMPLNTMRSYVRKYQGPLAQAPEGPYTGTSAIAVVKQPQTQWQQAWSALHDRVR